MGKIVDFRRSFCKFEAVKNTSWFRCKRPNELQWKSERELKGEHQNRFQSWPVADIDTKLQTVKCRFKEGLVWRRDLSEYHYCCSKMTSILEKTTSCLHIGSKPIIYEVSVSKMKAPNVCLSHDRFLITAVIVSVTGAGD